MELISYFDNSYYIIHNFKDPLALPPAALEALACMTDERFLY